MKQPADWENPKPTMAPPEWLLLAVSLLLLMVALPVARDWTTVMFRRPLTQNAMPLLALLLLGVALFRIMPPKARWQWHADGLGLAGLIVAMIFYLAGGLLSVKTLFWSSLIVLLASLYAVFFGRGQLWRAMPVFLFAFFLLPELPVDLKMAISLPLQLLSTQLTAGLAGLFIPLTAQGNVFYVNGNAFEVTVACSGLHTWMGFLFAGFVWMLFRPFRPRVLLAVLIAAPVLAVGLNTLRLLITALVAHGVSADAAISVHTGLDYLLFTAGLTAIWTLATRLSSWGDAHV